MSQQISAKDITPENINNFLSGHTNYLLRNTLLPKYIKEQAEWRMKVCQPCVKAGKCLKCGCKSPQLFYAPLKTDKDGKWGTMVSKTEWDEFKRTSPQYSRYYGMKEENPDSRSNP